MAESGNSAAAVPIEWPSADSDDFVRVLCLFAEHLSDEELGRGLLVRIRAHGRPLIEHLNRLILSERMADAARRAMIVSAIGATGQAGSLTALRAALDDPAPQVVRAAALAAWSRMRDDRLVPRLLELLGRPGTEPDVAVAAAESLSRFKAAEALGPAVRLALSAPSRLTDEEREQMLAAVERLAGVRFGDTAELSLRQRTARLRSWWRQRDSE